jgi:tetratricopeptide (TPR) repeat protein
MERLAALGYIGASAAKKPSSGKRGGLADPKDKLQIFEAVQRSSELIFDGKHSEAAEILKKVLDQDPEVTQALLLLSTCYEKMGRSREAKEKLDLVLGDNPNNVPALIGMAIILEKEGRKEDVIALCRRALSIDDKNTQAYTLIGEVYIDEENHSQALPFLEKAVEIQPKLAQNRLNLAVCLVGLRQYVRAESLLKEIAVTYPKFPVVNYHLGLLYEEQGRFEDAKKAYAEEISLYPSHFRARFNMGRLLFKGGDLQGYIDQMQEVVRTAPQAAEGHLFLARGLFYQQADLSRIVPLIDRGLALAKTAELKAFGYFLLADVYTRNNMPDKAQEAIRRGKSYKIK